MKVIAQFWIGQDLDESNPEDDMPTDWLSTIEWTRFDGHMEAEFLVFLMDPDNVDQILMELQDAGADVDNSPTASRGYSAEIEYHWDEGDTKDNNLWPGWIFSFVDDSIKELDHRHMGRHGMPKD